jgi:signal transduction histidine kinase
LLSKVTGFVSEDTFKQVRVDEILWKSRTEILKTNRNYTIKIGFDKSIEGEHHFYIRGNDQLLKTAFANLIKNGCKYSVDKKSEIKLSVTNSSMQVVFKDNGIGIPDTELENLFQPFYRGSNVKKQRGHGIGLSLVEKIIHLHGGEITVKSKIKKGTEFIVTLPFN